MIRGICGIFVVAAAWAAAGCKNSNYCEGNPDNDCRSSWDGGGPDESTGCTTSAQCAAPTPVCAVGSATCVQCTTDEAAACMGTTPLCDDGDHVCRGCEAHAECASQACLPDGSCADASTVAYVAAGGTGTACTQAAPCPLLADAIGKNLPYVKVAATGAANASSTVQLDGKTVTILAEPGATVDRDGDGPILEVRSANADVSIYDLILSGATSASGAGVLVTPNGGSPALTLTRVTIQNNQGDGIATSGGSVTVNRSTIVGNDGNGLSATGGAITMSRSTVATNGAGGITISGTGTTFSITNNFIYRNGDQDTGTYGGVNLGIATAGSNVFAFNTVTDNRAAINSAGVICNVATLSAPNNIIARNALGGSTTVTNAQTTGACTYPTSIIQNDVAGLNFADSEAPAPFSYKLMAGSTAIDFATTTSPIDVDHDGDSRPQGTQKDCGADEFAP